MGSIVPHGEVSGERVAGGLDKGAEESEGAQTCGVGVKGGADLLEDSGEQ